MRSDVRPGPRGLLSGLAKCGVCRSGLRQSNRGGRRVYGCRGGHVYVEADWLDEWVAGRVLALAPWTGPRRRPDHPTTARDRATLERRLSELEDDRDAGLVSRERFVERRARILERLGRSTEPQPRLEVTPWEELKGQERRIALREVLVM